MLENQTPIVDNSIHYGVSTFVLPRLHRTTLERYNPT